MGILPSAASLPVVPEVGGVRSGGSRLTEWREPKATGVGLALWSPGSSACTQASRLSEASVPQQDALPQDPTFCDPCSETSGALEYSLEQLSILEQKG